MNVDQELSLLVNKLAILGGELFSDPFSSKVICFLALVSFTYSRCPPIRVSDVMASGIRHQQKLEKFVEEIQSSVSVGINCWYQDKICSYNTSDVLKVKICVSFSFQYILS